ncbi:glyoxylase-like metal-dependent hydrolase (beta-lactamase superfamily II) [Streptomyces sp. B3I7]|uniref:MBL fold metallo-hydrolase n=1 Tax=Streptomyces sp. B3I7 TaxID=3042269 RepID=UPI002787E91B|nr:MBL fold metallo-hydrolase [Streptomyces sp. B3I7]MDQ0809420.1 glyoxylase-like metal-dependent hydrolase (beta-lactamase superfamily II) [Streptomyces sp. B3I7]
MASALRNEDIVRIGDDVHMVTGSDTNWVIVKEGGTAVLIDTGYPGDRERLYASLAAVGVAPGAVAAVLITHAHNDHLGSAEHLAVTHGTPVLMHQEEVPHARRDFLHQVTIGQVLGQAWRRGVAPWALRALRVGGTAHIPVTGPRAFAVGGPLDLPGAPVPVHSPGHTHGHCAYLLPGSGVLVSGDALVTAHPTSRVRGPQLLPGMFHADRARALDSLSVFEAGETGGAGGVVDADVLVPGHGPPHRGSVKAAVAAARERAEGRVR